MPTISASDWFRRKRATTSADPKAAYRRLVRMLAGDAERRAAAPVTLPGRHAERDLAPSPAATAPRSKRTGHI
jgi:hypothetical protein